MAHYEDSQRRQSDGHALSNFGTRYGDVENLGLGLYRNNGVCFGEGPQSISNFLRTRNLGAVVHAVPETEQFNIDIAAMLCLAVGNPAHLGFSVVGTSDFVEFKIVAKDILVSRALLNHYPGTGSIGFSPEVAHEYHGLNLGVLNCLLGARIGALMWGKPLLSHPQQRSKESDRVWKYLKDRGLAHKFASNRYAFSEDAANSPQVRAVLRSFLKQEELAPLLRETRHYALPRVSGRQLKSNLGDRQILWIDGPQLPKQKD